MYYFIVNPHSRSGAGGETWGILREELVRRRVPYRVFFTEYVGHGVRLAAQISSEGTADEPVRIVAVGGDGTIQEVLTGIRDLDCVILGYIPTGSGNDFCRSLKLPHEPVAALDSILAEGRILSMDVPCVTRDNICRRFGISAGIGFDAAVCQEVSASPAKKYLNRLGLGKLIYLFIALKQLLFMRLVPMSIELDGRRSFHYNKVYFAAVMNQKYEGGGFKFCPRASSSDGILDVIVVEGFCRLKLLFCLPTAFFGRHTRFQGVHILRCRSISIHSPVPLAIHRDGESDGLHCELSVSLEKKPLKVILPVV